MIILSNFVQFHNFAQTTLHYLNFYGRILASLKFQKFQTRNAKAMALDKKVNIAVTCCSISDGRKVFCSIDHFDF